MRWRETSGGGAPENGDGEESGAAGCGRDGIVAGPWTMGP